MIRRLKRKLVLINLLLVSAVLLAVFLLVYSSSKESIQSDSMEVLQRVINLDGAAVRPGGDPEEIQLPYFTVRLFSDGTAVLSGGAYFEFESVEEVSAIVSACLAQNQTSGVVKEYNLRYLRSEGVFVERIAFVDISMEQSTLSSLLWSLIRIALLSLLVLLAISIALAEWAVRPVERSMLQQQQFLSDASHELKTPLTVILSNLALLEEESGENRWLENIGDASARMKTLVEEMLTLARNEDPHRAEASQELSFSDLVTNELLLFEPVAFESGKPLQEELQPELRLCGSGDSLRRLVSILLDNAIKYGSEGAEIRITLRREGKKAVLRVSNAAEPLSPEQLSHLFDRFYRADDSRGETRGFGLGLSIAKAIAQQHGGSIRAESADGRVVFTVTLPLRG